MATSSLKLTPQFTDGTKGTPTTFKPYTMTADAITNAKTNIMEFNSASDIDDFKNNFVNENGSTFDKWVEAHIITVERTDYNVAAFTKRF